MDCRRFSELIGPYLDGELSTELSDEFIRHMDECEACRRELEEQKKLLELTGTLSFDAPDYLPAAMESIRSKSEKKRRVNTRRMIRYISSAAAVFVIFAVAAFVIIPNINQSNSSASDVQLESASEEYDSAGFSDKNFVAEEPEFAEPAEEEAPAESSEPEMAYEPSEGLASDESSVMDLADDSTQIIYVDDKDGEALCDILINDYTEDIAEFTDGIFLFVTEDNRDALADVFSKYGQSLTAKADEFVILAYSDY